MSQENIQEIKNGKPHNVINEIKRKPYIKPAFTIYGDLDVITQNLSKNPCDGCCGRSA